MSAGGGGGTGDGNRGSGDGGTPGTERRVPPPGDAAAAVVVEEEEGEGCAPGAEASLSAPRTAAGFLPTHKRERGVH